MVLLALVLLSSGPALAEHTGSCRQGFIEIDSEPGELIGRGEQLRFDAEDPGVTFGVGAGGYQGDPFASTVVIRLTAPDHDWTFIFSSRKLGTFLAPGTYADAMRFPFEDPGRPGMAVSANHRGWGVLNGSFRIHEASFYTATSQLRTRWIVVEFEQRGHDLPETLRGHIECRVDRRVSLDLRPETMDPSVDVSREARVNVALLGDGDLDLRDVLLDSLRFGPGGAAPLKIRQRDVNRDGHPDLVSRLRVADLSLDLTDDTLCVEGDLATGQHLYGCDAVDPQLSPGVAHWTFHTDFPGRGWFDSEGFRDESIDNTFTGSLDRRHLNSFLLWDLAVLEDRRVRSATLRLGVDRVFSREASETIEISEVSHDRDALLGSYAAGDPAGVAIYEDLGEGELYGSFELDRSQDVYEVPLSSAAVDRINLDLVSDGRFAIGLRNATDDLDGFSDGVRFDLMPVRMHELVLELEPRR